MNKKDAVSKARAGMSCGDLTEILNNAVDDLSGMSKVNKSFTKRAVWDMMHGALAGYFPSISIVDPSVATNILREFAPDEPRPVKEPLNPNGIPF